MKYSKELHDKLRHTYKGNSHTLALLDEIERLQAERRWIPVSERLPEDCIDVIVCEIMMDFQCVSAGFYDEAGRQWFSNGEGADFVTHWMPLPEPPDES